LHFAVSSVVTPAVVASAVSLFFNHRSEKKRAARDYLTKAFDSARDDVRRAVEYAVDYFPLRSDERTPAKEARLLMGDRDVRLSIGALIDFSAESGPSRNLLQSALDDFISVLTGGSFQSSAADADLDQARLVASAGAALRAAIAKARHLELEDAVKSDVLSRSADRLRLYLNENMGVESEPLADREMEEMNNKPAE